tara:strand:+ start:44213 stop:45148 length:936 start_codon:yes stop_codon:yes gene_type:complete
MLDNDLQQRTRRTRGRERAIAASLCMLSPAHFRHLGRHLSRHVKEGLWEADFGLQSALHSAMTEDAWNMLCRRVVQKQGVRAEHGEKIESWLPHLEEAYDIALALARFGEIRLSIFGRGSQEASVGLYSWVEGARPEPDAELHYYTEQAFRRDPLAQLAVAQLHLTEEDRPRDFEVVQRWVAQALRDPRTRQRAMWIRAFIYRWWGDKPDYVNSFLWQYAAYRLNPEMSDRFYQTSFHLIDLSNLTDEALVAAEWLLGNRELDGITMEDVYGLMGDVEPVAEGEPTLADLWAEIDMLNAARANVPPATKTA